MQGSQLCNGKRLVAPPCAAAPRLPPPASMAHQPTLFPPVQCEGDGDLCSFCVDGYELVSAKKDGPGTCVPAKSKK